MKRILLVAALGIAALPFQAAALTTGTRPADVRIRVKEDVSIAPGETVATAIAIMGSVNVEGTVTGDAISVFGNVAVGPGGSVGGNAVTVAGRVTQMAGAHLGGRPVVIQSPARDLSRYSLIGIPLIAGGLAFLGALVVLASTVGFLVLVIAILVLFAAQVTAARRAIVTDPFRTLLLGVAAVLALVPLTVFLTATIIGIPLAIVVMTVALAAICLGSISVCEWIGSEMARWMRRPLTTVWAGLLGLAVLFLVGFVPWFGAVVHVLTVLIGLGAVVRTRFRALPETTEEMAGDKTGTVGPA